MQNLYMTAQIKAKRNTAIMQLLTVTFSSAGLSLSWHYNITYIVHISNRTNLMHQQVML